MNVRHQPSIPTGAWALLTALLCLAAGGIGGRALWCDEILRIAGQRMSVAQLLNFEHLRIFCTQTPVGYLAMRPWQALFGMETGGFLFAALSGAVVTAATLWTVRRVLGHPPGWLAALLVATNPLVIYYGSELAFYAPWAAAGAVSFALLTDAGAGGRGDPWRMAATAGAGTLFVAMHFAGLFIWSGMAAVAALTALTGVADSTPAAPRGRRPRLGPVALVLATPVLLNLPMYIGAAHAPEHIGSRALRWSHFGSLWMQLARYAGGLLPALTGGWWVGVALAALGATALLRTQGRSRAAALQALAMTASVAFFLAYAHLRDYMPHAARYWVYAAAPMLTLLAAGVEGLLRRGAARPLGAALGAAVLAANALVIGALLQEEGRPHPYLRLVRYLAALPPGRTVVSANHYEMRFFGGYYPVPHGGQMVAPCFWEEGPEARVAGLRTIWALAPDAVAYVTDDERAAEYRAAGVLEGATAGFQHVWPRLLRWVWAARLYPEPHHRRPTAPALRHADRASLAAQAEKTGRAVVLPDVGWRLVQFRDPRGTVGAALLAEAGTAALAVYVPHAAATAAATARPHTMTLDALSYAATRLTVDVAGQRLEGVSPHLPAVAARHHYLPEQRTADGLPPPAQLAAAGLQFVVEAQPTTLTLPMTAPRPGWFTVALASVRKTPWLLLRHDWRSGDPPSAAPPAERESPP